MFKIYLRLLTFVRPIGKYAVPYFIYSILHALFNTVNYIMLIPIIQAMFDPEFRFEPLYVRPEFAFDEASLSAWLRYAYTSVFGEYNPMYVLILLATVTVLMNLLSNTFRYLGAWTVENMRTRTLQRMRNELFDNVINLNVGFFSEQRKGDIMSRITQDVMVVQFCITNTLQVAFREPFLIIGYMIALVKISWELTIFSAIFLPLTALLIGSIVKRLRKSAKQAQENFGDMTSLLDEALTGVKVVKGYNATGYITGKFRRINDIYSRITRSMARRQQLASPMSEFLGISAAAVLLLYGGSLVLDGRLEAAGFIAYLAIFTQITRPVRSFTDAFSNINQGIAAGDRVLGLLDEKSRIPEATGAVRLEQFRDSIEFRDVSFSYDDSRKVIDSVSFTIRKGETVALVGPSGGGKSTLSELIPRFYDIQGGDILIDGTSIRNYTQESLRAHMSVVAQDTILFNDTIEGNISLGKLDATHDEIVAAAKVANAHDFIMETDKGYQTNIGDRGMKLSGGQRQRLSIARAVLKNPEILILDEATSALDTESEKLVQDALNSLLKGRTSIVIAHRLSTVHNADKIIVIDHGRIAEQGTHEELMARGGIYSKLIEMQSVA